MVLAERDLIRIYTMRVATFIFHPGHEFRFLKRDIHVDEWRMVRIEMIRVMMILLDTAGRDSRISSDITFAGQHSDNLTLLGSHSFNVSSVMTFAATKDKDDLDRYLHQR